MIRRTLLSLLNPVKILRAKRYQKVQRSYDRSAFDLELYLYSRILRNDMLHYGYFDDPAILPEDISIARMEAAQAQYGQLILSELEDINGRVLDAGCGMGGLTGLLIGKGFDAQALTPNDHQVEYVRRKYPHTAIHHCRFEDLEGSMSFQAVIHAESIQYIPLDEAFEKMEEILAPGGIWIITDYFRIRDDGVSTSGHLLELFRRRIEAGGWRIRNEYDITPNVLPTLKLIRFYADRFVIPLKHFALEKFRFKRPWWYFMTSDLQNAIEAKMEKELASIDPDKFKEEKRYMLFVLKR